MLILVVILNIFGKLTQRWSKFLLKGLKTTFQLLALAGSWNRSQQNFIKAVVEDIPIDIRSVQKALHILPPKFTEYAVCPNNRCSFVYERQYAPELCMQNIPGSSNRCETPLFRPCRDLGTGNVDPRPIRPFISFALSNLIAELVVLEPTCSLLKRRPQTQAAPSGDEEVHDIFESKVVREFEGPVIGPNGTKNFFDAEDNELRLLFTLCVDWMNPFGKNASNASGSIGIISLICINLPFSERYKSENIILAGIIPGPREPPNDTINYFLTPFIDEFFELWQTGVVITGNNTKGINLIRCSLLAVVADLPAARKVIGHASHSANEFCNLCRLPRNEMDNLNIEEWPRWEEGEQRRAAIAWRDADGPTRRELYKANGVRWSVLHRLPSFEPLRNVVVDMMHNLYLGLTRRHFLEIIRIDKSKTGKSRTHHSQLPPDPSNMRKGRTILNDRQSTSVAKKLEKELRWAELYALCRECNVPTLDKKATNVKSVMAKDLDRWVSLVARFVGSS